MISSHPRPRPSTALPPKAYFGGFTEHPLRSETQRYMRGDCGYMALAMGKLMPGAQLWKVGIGHFAAEDHQGRFWDIRGQMTLDQAWSGLSGLAMTPVSRDQVIAELNTGLYGDAYYTPSREAKARKLARLLLPPQALTKPGDTSPETLPGARTRPEPSAGLTSGERDAGPKDRAPLISPKTPRP